MTGPSPGPGTPQAAAPDPGRLSLNQMTTSRWGVREAVEGCARAGIRAIGLWRHKVAETGLAESARIAAGSGVAVSTLCRGGFFPAATAAGRLAAVDDNRAAIDEAAALGTGVLVLVCGPAPDRDIDAARGMVADGIAAVLPHAEAAGVRLAVEPMHPVFAGDRSVIVTLGEALDLVDHLGASQLGVAVDTYHVWWDPQVHRQLARAAGRILCLQVCDWLVPVTDPLHGRGMPGDGVIELRRLRTEADAAGYAGPIEVEIFNHDIWAQPGERVLEQVWASYLEHV